MGEHRFVGRRQNLSSATFRGICTRCLWGHAIATDGKAIYLLLDGKIHRLDLAKNTDMAEPFSCNMKRELRALHKAENKIPEGPVSGKHLRWLHSTPDGSKISFSE